MKVNSPQKREQIAAIKQRLNDEFQKYIQMGGTINSLLRQLNDQQGVELNYDTLRRTLSPKEESTLDLFCVLALCRSWQLDTAYVLSSPDNKEKPMPAANAEMNAIKFKVLDDPAYLGTYYGYLFSNKRDDHQLHNLQLKIENTKASGFTVSLTVESKEVLKDGVQALEKKLHGVPILSTFNENIL